MKVIQGLIDKLKWAQQVSSGAQKHLGEVPTIELRHFGERIKIEETTAVEVTICTERIEAFRGLCNCLGVLWAAATRLEPELKLEGWTWKLFALARLGNELLIELSYTEPRTTEEPPEALIRHRDDLDRFLQENALAFLQGLI